MEIERKCLILRWMDDVMFVVDPFLSQRGRRTLWKLGRRRVTGGQFSLQEVEILDSFGFIWRDDEGVLTVRPEAKLSRVMRETKGQEGSNAYCGLQCESTRIIFVVVGYALRPLVCANASEVEVRSTAVAFNAVTTLLFN